MKKPLTLTLITCIYLISCSKTTPVIPTVEVRDAVTKQPVAGAEVVVSDFSNAKWDWSCLCNYNVIEVSKGFTNDQGVFTGMLDLEHLTIYKDGYYPSLLPGILIITSIYEKSDKHKVTISIFRKGNFEITSNPTQLYSPEPRISVAPVMPDGTTKSFGYITYTYSMTPYLFPGVGDCKNRLVVFRDLGNFRYDTLFKQDIYLPRNTTMPVNITY